MSIKIVKGDTVEVIAGDDKGHRGEVLRVIRRKTVDGKYDPNRAYVIVAGANIVVKHQGYTGGVQTQRGRIEMEAPLHISNVALIGVDEEPTRVGYLMDGLDKVRFDRKSGEEMPKPTA